MIYQHQNKDRTDRSRQPTDQDEYYNYLFDLQASGVTNMYGASAYLVQTYHISCSTNLKKHLHFTYILSGTN